MSILLATPYNPGDLDPGVIYTHVELKTFGGDFFANVITFSFVRGTVDGSNNFLPGKVAPTMFQVVDRPARGGNPPKTDYSDMMEELTLDGEKASSSVARIIYTYVLTNGIFVGTPIDPNA